MHSNSNLVYALAAMTALALGLGVSFWRTSAENKGLVQANLTTRAALEAAQDEAKALRERLLREVKGRDSAEAAQKAAQASERATREQLMHETKAKQVAEAARIEAEAQLNTAAFKLAQETEARVRTGAALEAANADLAQEREARAAAELRRDEAVETIAELTVKLNEKGAARVQGALTEVEGQIRLLCTNFAGKMADGEEAVIMKMAALSWRGGSQAAQAADETRDEANNDASVRSPEIASQMPASLATEEPKARPAAAPAPLNPANDVLRRDLIVQ